MCSDTFYGSCTSWTRMQQLRIIFVYCLWYIHLTYRDFHLHCFLVSSMKIYVRVFLSYFKLPPTGPYYDNIMRCVIFNDTKANQNMLIATCKKKYFRNDKKYVLFPVYPSVRMLKMLHHVRVHIELQNNKRFLKRTNSFMGFIPNSKIFQTCRHHVH